MFAVFIDRPYYPELVGIFPNREDAAAAARARVAEETAEDDGHYDVTIYVCEVVSSQQYRSRW